MDLNKYTKQELFQAAIRSEQESTRVYARLAAMVKNIFLKEKLEYLAKEEEKHTAALMYEFIAHFPNEEMIIPERSPVPLPEILIPDENVQLSEVIDSAIKAEIAARDFYLSMKDLFPEDDSIRKTLDFFAAMENAHFTLLSIERENLARFEEYDTYWDVMNIGL